jgi:RNA polymerase sigma factor (sigma-70 family)
LEASALTHASRRGLLVRRSPLLKLQGDEKLVALVRDGDPGAFDAIVDRYQARLLGFCRQMLRSTEDAEDVLQEVFVNAYRAILADNREINLRPWLYRIARNRSLNHLRKPTADAKESMDTVPEVEAASTHETVHNREEFRQLLADVKKLPETQRSALLLREMDAMSYEEIALAMETTVPSIKSLLVRARISLAEASQARLLTCGEVRLELAEAAEGLGKASGPVRRHVRECEECGEFRNQIRSDAKVLAALSPIGPLLALKALLGSKLGFGGGAGAAGGAGAGAAGAGAGGAMGAGAMGAGGAALGGAAGGGLSAVGGAIGAKAVAGVVTAAVLTAGAVEVEKRVNSDAPQAPQQVRILAEERPAAPATVPPEAVTEAPPVPAYKYEPAPAPAGEPAPAPAPEPAPAPAPAPPAEEPAAESAVPPEAAAPVAPAEPVEDPAAGGSNAGTSGDTAPATGGTTTGTYHPSGETAVVVVGEPDSAAPAQP